MRPPTRRRERTSRPRTSVPKAEGSGRLEGAATSCKKYGATRGLLTSQPIETNIAKPNTPLLTRTNTPRTSPLQPQLRHQQYDSKSTIMLSTIHTTAMRRARDWTSNTSRIATAFTSSTPVPRDNSTRPLSLGTTTNQVLYIQSKDLDTGGQCIPQGVTKNNEASAESH